MSNDIRRGRREFLKNGVRSGVRWAALGALAAVAVVLGRRSLGGDDAAAPAGERCVNRSICSSCSRNESCTLPQALSRRQARERT